MKNISNKKAFWYLVLIMAIITILRIGWFELTKTCGNCEKKIPQVEAFNIDEKYNGQTVNSEIGHYIRVTLHNTYWKFSDVDSKVLEPVVPPSYDGKLTNPPGTGEGTVTALYKVTGTGDATITASRITCGEALMCSPDQQKYSVTIHVLKIIEDTTCATCKFEYRANNGSVPPQYHREYVLTASEDKNGKVTAEYSVESGYPGGMGGYPSTVLEKKSVSMSIGDFRPILNAAFMVSPDQTNSLNGCTGGSNESVKVYNGDKVVKEAHNYSCARQMSDPSFADFFPKLIINFLPAANQ